MRSIQNLRSFNVIRFCNGADLTTMDDSALQMLYKRITANSTIPYGCPIQNHLLTLFKQEKPDFIRLKMTESFLQQVAHGFKNDAEAILIIESGTAQELLTAHSIPFTDCSGRTFTCTAYEYAYWAKDTHMCRFLETHMDQQTKQELLIRIQRMEELVGLEFITKSPRGLTYTQNGQEHQSAHFSLVPLIEALRSYIQAFHQNLDSELHLKKDLIESDWDNVKSLWLEVGKLQREVPVHIAQEYCNRSFEEISENSTVLEKPILGGLLGLYGHSSIQNSSAWFAPESDTFKSDLGVTFAILAVRDFAYGKLGTEDMNDKDIVQILQDNLLGLELIEKTRTKELRDSSANLDVSQDMRAGPAIS